MKLWPWPTGRISSWVGGSGREKLRMPLRWAGCGGPPSGKDEVVGVSGGEEGTVGRRANRTFGVDGWESSEESESQSEESDEDDIFGGIFFYV